MHYTLKGCKKIRNCINSFKHKFFGQNLPLFIRVMNVFRNEKTVRQHKQRRNFGLKSGGTDSEGERAPVGPKRKGRKWG